MTQAEENMSRSLQLADLWYAMRQAQISIDQRILPTLEFMQADPDGELTEALNNAVAAIEKHFASYKLQAVPTPNTEQGSGK